MCERRTTHPSECKNMRIKFKRRIVGRRFFEIKLKRRILGILEKV